MVVIVHKIEINVTFWRNIYLQPVTNLLSTCLSYSIPGRQAIIQALRFIHHPGPPKESVEYVFLGSYLGVGCVSPCLRCVIPKLLLPVILHPSSNNWTDTLWTNAFVCTLFEFRPTLPAINVNCDFSTFEFYFFEREPQTPFSETICWPKNRKNTCS